MTQARHDPACPIAGGSGVYRLNSDVSLRDGYVVHGAGSSHRWTHALSTGSPFTTTGNMEAQMRNEMRGIGVVIAVCGAAVFSGLSAAVAAKPPKNVPVTSIVLDYAADVAPRLNIQSDGLGSYVPASNLVSEIQAIGDWVLDARNPKNATRKIYVDFGQPIAGSAPGGRNPTSPPSGAYKFRAIAQCSVYGNSLLGFAAGDTKTCPLRIGIDYGGSTWLLVMDPYTGVNGPFPQTDYATVTCIYPTTGTSACSQWKLTPSGSYVAADGSVEYRNVAKLLQNPSSNNPIDHGDFHVSFAILFAR